MDGTQEAYFNPFDKEIRGVYGPYTSSKDRRSRMVFWLTDGTHTTMLRSRWLMTQKLKRRLVAEEEVDHIDNNPYNDDITNLQILTPLGNRLKKIQVERLKGTGKPNYCKDCGKRVMSHRQARCDKCFKKSQEKIIWPPSEVLVEMLKSSNYLALGRQLGVSDNAIRKRLKHHPPKDA